MTYCDVQSKEGSLYVTVCPSDFAIGLTYHLCRIALRRKD